MFLMGKKFLLVLVGGTLGLVGFELAHARTTHLVEIAPLKGAVGHFAGRFETALPSGLRMGIELGRAARAGDLPGYDDLHLWGGAGLVWYPGGTKPAARPFVHGLLQAEWSEVGRRARRDYMTWFRFTADEAYDTWVNKDLFLSQLVGAGYRYDPWPWLTTSLRLDADLLLWTYGTVVERDMVHVDRDTSSPGRDPTRWDLSLRIGLAF